MRRDTCDTQMAMKVYRFSNKIPLASLAGAAVLGWLLLVQGCTATSSPVTQTRELPFAHTTLTLYDHAADATFAACFSRIETILNKFNMYSADSEISAVNRAAGTGAVQVSDDFCEVLRQGLQLSNLTDGLFDPTVGPLVKLWKVGSDKPRIPKPDEIRSALRLIGWKDVVLDEKAKTVTLRRAGNDARLRSAAQGLFCGGDRTPPRPPAV